MRLILAFAIAVLTTATAHAACGGRVVEGSVMGSPICVPSAPNKIISLDPTFSLGMALELGLPIAGAPLQGMSDKALRQKALEAGVVDFGSFMQPSIEMIVGLQPDLIIGSGFLGEEVFKMASSLAPSAFVTAQNWKDYYRTLAEVAGRAEAVGDAFREYDRRLLEIRARVPRDLTVSVVRITPWEFQVYTDAPNAYAPFDILREAGVRRPEFETSTTEGEVKRLDFEGLSGIEGDVLLYIVGGANNSADSGHHEAVLANPLWQMIPAVKAGRVHRVDVATWMEFSGVASANKVLDDIERYVIGAR